MDIIEDVSNDNHYNFIEKIAKRPRLSGDTILKLSVNKHPFVSISLTYDPNNPYDILKKISKRSKC
jgi:hypothetical protein